MGLKIDRKPETKADAPHNITPWPAAADTELSRLLPLRARLRNRALAFGLASFVALSALVAQLALEPYVVRIRYLVLYPAVFFVAWFLGVAPALWTLLLCLLGSAYLFFEPIHSLAVHEPGGLLRLLAFAFVSLLMIGIIGLARRTEHQRDEAIHELASTIEEIRAFKFALDEASIFAVTDRGGVITYVNDRFCEISKYSRDELIGRTHRLLNSGLHPPEFFAEMWQHISAGKVWRGEIRNRAKDGSFYWVDTVIVPFSDRFGRPYRYLAIRNDITAQKLLEESLREAVRARDEFITIASHELKTPLTSLKLQTEVVSRAVAKGGELDPERLSRLLEVSERQIERLSELIDEMIDIAHGTGSAPQPARTEVDLRDLVSELVARFSRRLKLPGPQVSIALEEGLQGFWDKTQLSRALGALLSNAAKYGGQGLIEVRGRRLGPGVVEIRVTDHGIGISPRDQARIFGRFERAVSPSEASGFGVGLFTARRIIEAHGGTIRVESLQGVGSTFIVELPAALLSQAAG